MKSPFTCDQDGLGPSRGDAVFITFSRGETPTHRVGTVGHAVGPKLIGLPDELLKTLLGCVTIDPLMKCSKSFGVDWKFRFRDPTVLTHREEIFGVLAFFFLL